MAIGIQSGPRHLHQNVKLVWFAPTAAAILLIWLVSSVFLSMLPPDAFMPGAPRPIASIAILFIMLIVIGFPVYAYVHLEYLSFTYELAKDEVVIREGVFTRNTTVIPYGKIQNINTKRTVIERLIGLATLHIETAGTNPGQSEGILPGVEKKDALVSEILSHVEKAKKEAEYTGAPASLEAKILKTEAELLADILKELVQLNKSINSHYGTPSGAQRPEGGKWPGTPLSPHPPYGAKGKGLPR